MTQFNFNVPLLDVKGKPVPGQTLAMTLSELLGTETKGQSLKKYGWHKTLQIGDELSLDDADKKLLEETVDSNENYFVYVKGQIFDILNKK